MVLIIEYGDEVDFDPTPFTPPVAFDTSAVGTVKRVAILTGTPSEAQINNLIEFGER